MKMVDIGDKEVTLREAIVEGMVALKPKVLLAIKRNEIPKGNVLEAAKLAGILAAKNTPGLIPLCHPIPIDCVNVEFSLSGDKIRIKATVRGMAKTGVEMEALTATAIAALTIYDMCKPLDKDIVISDIKLMKKTGGKSGTYVRNGKVMAVSISDKKGMRKRNVESAELREDFGIVGDAHAGSGNRQVSLLAEESIEKMRSKGLKVRAGDFAENITTGGIDLLGLKISDKLKIGEGAVLEITQFGKECHARCNIYYRTGDCVMPKEGVFARVLKGGIIKNEDKMKVIKDV